MTGLRRSTGRDRQIKAAKKVIASPEFPKPGEVWRHFKGDEVVVVGHCLNSETVEPMVRYIHFGVEWSRPYGMWCEKVIDPNGPNSGKVSRFFRERQL